MKPQPGQFIEVLETYRNRVGDTPIIGSVFQVIRPGEYEEGYEVTVVFDGDELYVPVEYLRIVAFVPVATKAVLPDLLTLAALVADEYEDAADWKDAKPTLQRLARTVIAAANGG